MTGEANPYMEAMILCGINLGFGNTDCSLLEKREIDFKSDWYALRRTKTGVLRMGQLWPETVKALRWVAEHPRSKCTAELRGRMFVTKYGNEYCPDGGTDAIAREFLKLKEACGITRKNAGFYALRHVTQTIGEQSGDPLAVKILMGHVDSSISETYRDHFDPDRVKIVCNCIRDWYLAG